MERFAQVHRQLARDGFVDLAAISLPRRTLTDHLRSIGAGPHLPNLWVPDPDHVEYRVRCRAALAYLGEPAVLTGASALFLLGVLRHPPDHVELLLPADRWIRPREGWCVHYATDFARLRSVSCDRMRLVRAARALADHSRHARFTPLCCAIADAVRLRHCTLAHVGEEIDARASFPGRTVLRRAYRSLTGELNHSGAERLGRRLLREAGEQAPPRPLPVIHRERIIAEVDLPFFELGYGLEIDGPHHLLSEVAAADRARDRMLARQGLTIDRYLWFELEEDPQRFVREVTAQLRARRAARNGD